MIQVLDRTRIEMLLELDVEGTREILSSFKTSVDDRFEQIVLAIESQNSADLELHAHSLKGTAANLGFELLSEIAAEIEIFGKNDDFNQASSRVESLNQTILQSKQELNTVLD